MVKSAQPQNPPFSLGEVHVTSSASEALMRASQTAGFFLGRYVIGDWGDIDQNDRRLNERALIEGNALLGSYKTRLGDMIWILTEADRSVTTLMLPSEF